MTHCYALFCMLSMLFSSSTVHARLHMLISYMYCTDIDVCTACIMPHVCIGVSSSEIFEHFLEISEQLGKLQSILWITDEL